MQEVGPGQFDGEDSLKFTELAKLQICYCKFLFHTCFHSHIFAESEPGQEFEYTKYFFAMFMFPSKPLPPIKFNMCDCMNLQVCKYNSERSNNCWNKDEQNPTLPKGRTIFTQSNSTAQIPVKS